MHRSSESIGTIAAALAQAQAELINPEKSLVATIRSPFPRESDRTFRYAPLSSGLEIVRKSLGRREIATFQTTAIDKDTGLVRLTTLLAHSSGEWVSSEWPVCPISDTASPQRMGAALTYARRYALFTLVGIAGEDDLDAPDLSPGNGQATISNDQSTPRLSDGPAPGYSNGSAHKRPIRPAKKILAPEASAVLRAQLMTELEIITTSEEAITWARHRIPAKNTLTADDARIIEDAFEAKMIALAADQEQATDHGEPVTDKSDDPRSEATGIPPNPSRQGPDVPAADGTVVLKPHRLRDKPHREFVATHPCLVCGRRPSDAHHLRFAQPRALGRKVSDEFTVPLCREHHGEVHRRGDEARWWKDAGTDALAIARDLWARTQSNRLLKNVS
jgi:ERF superfamily